MTAALWPLPVATLSQLWRLWLTFAFSYRFVITRPANEFKLLPSDLVFCAIPFNISCQEKDKYSNQGSYGSINVAPQASKTPEDINNSPTANPVGQTTTQLLNTSVHLWEPKTSPDGNPKQSILTQRGELSPRTQPGKENLKESPMGLPVPIQTWSAAILHKLLARYL